MKSSHAAADASSEFRKDSSTAVYMIVPVQERHSKKAGTASAAQDRFLLDPAEYFESI